VLRCWLRWRFGWSTNDFDERLHERRTVTRADFEQLEALAWNQREIGDSSLDAARFIGSLTAVDGAVVLTTSLGSSGSVGR
jgi:hypothetical protein